MSPQAQVAFLQGERKGQENLKTDLVRRIKMLEYALKQERWVQRGGVLGLGGDPKNILGSPRVFLSPPFLSPLPLFSRSKYHKLKFGTEPAPGDKKPEALEPGACPPKMVWGERGGTF